MTKFETLFFRRFEDQRSTLLLSLIPQDNQRFTERPHFPPFELWNWEVCRSRIHLWTLNFNDQVVNHTGMLFCFPLWKGLWSKDRLNFSCFRIIPFWILTTKSGFQSSAVVSHIFLRFVTLKWQRKFEPLALAALVALSGSAEYLPMMFFENLSKSVRLHLARFYRKRSIAGNGKQTWPNIKSIKIY